jgi:hypothetical protein
MMWSGAFGAIGFGTFEFAKGFLGVSGTNEEQQSSLYKETTTAQKNGQRL